MAAGARSAEEIRRQVVEHVSRMVDYWAGLPGLSVADRCDGVAFSLLTMLDGAASLPRFDLAVAEGDGYPVGVIINADCDLHDVYSQFRRDRGLA